MEHFVFSNENELTGSVIKAAYKVHSYLGPGMLESAYRSCLAHQLRMDGFEVEEEKTIPLIYEGLHLNNGYRLDILINRKLVIELKSVEALNQVHVAQVLTYLKFGNYKYGLLINFNEVSLKYGIRRLINKHFR